MISLKNNSYFYNSNAKLGGGSFAKVFKVVRSIDNSPFAVKIIAKTQFENQGGDYLKKCFNREVAIQSLATKSGLPFFVQLIDKFEDGKNIYLVLELCEQNLLEHTRDKLLSEETALEFTFQIGIGLNYLHSIQVSHRDIKMENVMIKSGILKIADFGFASQSQIMSTNLGTPPFMAPEFFNPNTETYSPKIDVWALNTCLYYFLTNKLFFMSQNPKELKSQILTKEFVITKETEQLKSETKNLLLKGYIKNPVYRPSMEDYISHSCFGFLFSKYNAFLKISELPVLSNDSLNKLRIPETEGDNQEYRCYLMNFRNNNLLYIQMSKLISDIGFNILFAFLLVKRSMQNITAIVGYLKTNRIPCNRNFEQIKFEVDVWSKFCHGHWIKLISSVFVNDFQRIGKKYNQMCKSLLNVQTAFSNVPSFDINEDESSVITYFCNEIITKLGQLSSKDNPEEFKTIIKFAQRILIYEKYSPNQMVLAYVPIR